MTQAFENQAALEMTTARTTEVSRRLHLGCFDRQIHGWINTDVTPHLWVARIPGLAALLWRLGQVSDQRYDQHQRGVFRSVRYMNAAKTFPYPDNYFSAVFFSHLLEHLRPVDAHRCLSEIQRTLQPGGVCRVVVPDLDLLVNSYDPREPDMFLKRLLEPSERQKNSHHWLYNPGSLIALVLRSGFRKAYRCDFQQGQCPDLKVLDNRPEVSLYVEAIK